MGGLQDLLRTLPAVDRVLREEPLRSLSRQLPQHLLSHAVQTRLDCLRARLLEQDGTVSADQLQPAVVAADAASFCRLMLAPSLRQVINASGTLLHTNLGRAPLARDALRAIDDVAAGYSNLEMELTSGSRGDRSSHVERLLVELTGAEAALVVNNNAGAVLLALTALAKGREAIVSRGELVEIGGAFRIPEVMETGGVRLHEVGATNRTHPHDYQRAINQETAILLKVHTSNYRILGFSGAVSSAELAALAHDHQLVAMEDLGSGLLFDLSRYGLPSEPTVREVITAGMDVVTFSGDKLLGGPQAGLIVGRRDLIASLRKHPLARALRIDKLTLAALEATLRLYLQPQQALEQIPVLQMLTAGSEQLSVRCCALKARLEQGAAAVAMDLVEDISRVGGGAMPLAELPTPALALRPQTLSVDALARRLRRLTPAVVARSHNDRLLVNLRGVLPQQDALLAQLLLATLENGADC